MANAKYIRADGTYTLDAYRKIEAMAKANKVKRLIAVELGITFRTFEGHCAKNKGDNEVQLAWERGHAEVEQEVADFFYKKMKADTDKNAVVAAIFFAKARVGWTDKDPIGTQVGNNIQIVLPAPQTREQYFKTLGIEAPIDSRMKDVTPKPAQIAAPIIVMEPKKEEPK